MKSKKILAAVMASIIGASALGGVAATSITSSAATVEHTVKAGDNIWDLAVKYYRDGSKWSLITNANKFITNINFIQIGQKLVIPDANVSTETPSQITGPNEPVVSAPTQTPQVSIATDKDETAANYIKNKRYVRTAVFRNGVSLSPADTRVMFGISQSNTPYDSSAIIEWGEANNYTSYSDNQTNRGTYSVDGDVITVNAGDLNQKITFTFDRDSKMLFSTLMVEGNRFDIVLSESSSVDNLKEKISGSWITYSQRVDNTINTFVENSLSPEILDFKLDNTVKVTNLETGKTYDRTYSIDDQNFVTIKALSEDIAPIYLLYRQDIDMIYTIPQTIQGKVVQFAFDRAIEDAGVVTVNDLSGTWVDEIDMSADIILTNAEADKYQKYFGSDVKIGVVHSTYKFNKNGTVDITLIESGKEAQTLTTKYTIDNKGEYAIINLEKNINERAGELFYVKRSGHLIECVHNGVDANLLVICSKIA